MKIHYGHDKTFFSKMLALDGNIESSHTDALCVENQ